jgi:hypothetical protein
MPFRPSSGKKTCVLDVTIGKFPEYVGEPIRTVTRKFDEDEEGPPPWLVTKKNESRPNSSILAKRRNLSRLSNTQSVSLKKL